MSANELKLATDDPFLQGNDMPKLESDPFLIQKPQGNQIKYLYLDDMDAQSAQAKQDLSELINQISEQGNGVPNPLKQKYHIAHDGAGYHPSIKKDGMGDSGDSHSIIMGLLFIALVTLLILYISTLINKGKGENSKSFGEDYDLGPDLEKLNAHEEEDFTEYDELELDKKEEPASQEELEKMKEYVLKESESLYDPSEIKKKYVKEIETSERRTLSEEELRILDKNIALYKYARLELLTEITRDLYESIRALLFSSEISSDYFWYTSEIKAQLISQMISYTGNDPKEFIRNIVFSKLRELLGVSGIKEGILAEIIEAKNNEKAVKKTASRKRKSKSEEECLEA
jgi:hypothetical protein